MKNVMEEKDFWGVMLLVFMFLALLYFVMGSSLTFLLIGVEWILLIGIFSMFRPLKRKEIKAANNLAAAFVGDHFIKIPNRDISYFDGIIGMGRPYLAIAKFKWAIGLFLLLATIFYLFRSVSFSFPLRSVFDEVVVVNFYTLASIFAGIIFGFVILVMWLAGRLPRMCYKKADFFVLPEGEEGKGVEVAKNEAQVTAGTGLMTIVRTSEKYFLAPHGLLILSKDDYIPVGELVSGEVLYLGEEPVLPHIELEEGEIKKDIQAEQKPIVIH